MSKPGESIDQLIDTNIKLWHQATKIKKNGKPDHSLPTAERVGIFYRIRELNAARSTLRWEIDSLLDETGTNETKTGYYKESK